MRLDGDNEVNWRHGMPSDIVYARTNEGTMLDRLDMMLLLNSESMGDRFYDNEKNGFEAYLPGRESIQIVQKQHVRGFAGPYAN